MTEFKEGEKVLKKPGYYSSGEFARMAHVTLRTIRYYDKQNILKTILTSQKRAQDSTQIRLRQTAADITFEISGIFAGRYP
mgnify:CR=1 FL=1